MKVDIFPTKIFRYHIEDHAPIKERVEQYYEEHKLETSTPEGWNCNLFTTFGTKMFPIVECMEEFGHVFDEFQDEARIPGNLLLTDLWMNCYDRTNWQDKHIHAPGQWSGVYYVHFDPNEHKGTQFYHPNETLLACQGEEQNTIIPWVTEGDLIIFPAWLEHSAPMNKSSKLRSTISFNFLITEEVYEGGEFDPEKLIVDGGVS